MTEERWLPVPGWEGLYEVSDRGNVRSLTRVLSKPGWGPFTRRGKQLRASESKGYLRVTLQDRESGRLDRRMVHQIVLTTFLGEPQPGQETRHLDGDRHNNALSNLRWGTRVENAADRDRHGNMRRSLNRGHCANNHPWDETTLTFDPKGRVYCKQCRRDHATKYRKQKTNAGN